MERGLVELTKDDFDQPVAKRITILLAVVICQHCPRKARLLPCDVIERKRYSARVIEHLVRRYSRGQEGLREVVVSVYEVSPSFTTLHEWTRGLGAHALGREISPRLGDSFSAVLAETTKRTPKLKTAASAKSPEVDERRYRTQAQRERLSAMAKLLAMATAYAPHCEFPLLAWREDALRFELRAPFVFRTGLSKPAIGHGDSKTRKDPPPDPTFGGTPCDKPTPTARSPPSAST